MVTEAVRWGTIDKVFPYGFLKKYRIVFERIH